MLDINRLTAFEALLKIEQEGAYSNLAVANAVRENHPGNEAFVRHLVYGVLQQIILLDYWLDAYVKTGVRKVKPRARVLLRMGLYQIVFMDSVPDYAAVSETVSLSRKKCPGLSSLINGVLRSCLRNPEKRTLPDRESDPAAFLSVKYSYSRDLTELWIRQFGEERAESLMAAGNQAPHLTICVNTVKTTRSRLFDAFSVKGFDVRIPETGKMPADQAEAVSSHALYLSGNGIIDTEEFRQGLFYVQDLSSMRAVAALAPLPGQQILDVCAAPGGKSFFASLLMEDRGIIRSCDIYDHKLCLIEKTAERLGLHQIQTMKKDASVFEPEFLSSADAVIVDVPCSGLGVVRRKPEIKWKMTKEAIQGLPLIQYKILENAAQYVRKDGKLLYSTCTISKVENQEVADRFLSVHPDFLKLEEQQILPDTDGSDGFYYCIMKKMA